ncbi:MAG: hypothetical protein BWY54_00080 [Candidatus Dependentiae bacterium ADurb.Bin331]|nr:MAG: hypothetical protein BWY54_00080 [Candidatus Dependentiae bacterium ADurb.Bin331]
MNYVKACAFFFISLLGAFINAAQFENTLLIINYNHAYYDSIPFLKELYAPYFSDIVFYGPEEHLDVTCCKHHEGFLSYITIADAMEKNPEKNGYFFLMDDCILNAWLLEPLDTNRIWYSDIHSFTSTRGTPIQLNSGFKAYSSWSIWLTKWGYPAALNAFNNLPQSYKNQLAQNWGEGNVVAAYSDLIYIPARLRTQFIELAVLFHSHELFLEIAVPTIAACLEPKTQWLWLKGEGTERNNPCKTFKMKNYFHHPIKLSSLENQHVIREIFLSQKKDK